MAMERFQRCRDLFANFKPLQSEMSLLDSPAHGMHAAFACARTLTDCLQMLHLHELHHESLHHAQLHHL